MRAQQQAIAQRLRLLSRDEERVLRIARGMVRGKVQRLEVVIISFNFGTFLNRVTEITEDAYYLVHRLDNRMFRADRAANAGESNVETLGRELSRRCSALNASERRFDTLLNFG